MVLMLESFPSSRKLVLLCLILTPIFLLTFLSTDSHLRSTWTNNLARLQNYGRPMSTPFPDLQSSSPILNSSLSPLAGHLHILIPANKATTNLCKSILSIVILGYGMPTLYGWNGSDSKMGKLTSFKPYLTTLDSEHDDDIIVITDGYDVWFQLPPDVLINRFRSMNDRGTERSKNSLGKADLNNVGLPSTQQRVVFASQKKCWPGKEESHVSCVDAPESPLLPNNIYGPDTDKILKSGAEPYHNVRRRYLNAGFVMGGVKDLRPLWDRALEKAQQDMDVTGHDQHVLAEMFGEQEAARQIAAGGEAKGKVRNITEDKLTKFEPEKGKNFEFGMGLDYSSELSLPTVFGARDVGWVTLSNHSSIDEAATMWNISDELVRAGPLPVDLQQSRRPFHAVQIEHDAFTGNITASWNDVPLFTDLYTGVSPVLIHLNEWRDDSKSLREKDWDKIWFQPTARQLLSSILKHSDQIVAVDDQGREWRSSVPCTEGRFGAQTMTEDGTVGWADWNSLCTEEDQEEIFRDGEGRWIDQVTAKENT